MRPHLYIVGVICLYVLSLPSAQSIKNQADAQNVFRTAQSVSENNRLNAENILGGRDNEVLQSNRGERNRQIQTEGNRENDFLSDFSSVQVQGESIAKVTADADLDAADFDSDGNFVSRTGAEGTNVPGIRGFAAPTTNAFNFINTVTKQSCVFDRANNAVCDRTTKFRTPSGHCNNFNRKTFGMAGTAFGRAHAATYQDGLRAVRTRTHETNKPLPDARSVSVAATTTRVVLDNLGFSNQLMQWGQFIAHDFTSIADTERNAICCPDQQAKQKFDTQNPTKSQIDQARAEIKRLRGDACIAIESPNDPVHGNVCMNQVRSATVPRSDCAPSPRLQMNTATHFCDGSGIYGSSTAVMNRLRTKRGGQLKVQNIGGVVLPPKQDESCSSQCPFAAGDPRINTTPNLITTHLLFIRKHNQIASELARINSRWNDERLFQETRRIISAIVQNIHYNEWIQHLLDTRLDKYRLRKSSSTEYRNTYSQSTDPSLLNELAGAALRFGHTTVGGIFKCARSNRLKDNFNKPDIIYQNGIDECLAGMAGDRPWRFDKNFVKDMRDNLFDIPLDIVALNIKRGRDHGFDSYAGYRKHYGFRIITTWSDLSSTHEPAAVTMLRSIYDDPRDIELYIGGVTEKKQRNGFIGELFAEILGDGFMRVRNGDRLYFESQTAGFTLAQVNALRAYRYSNLICDVGGVTSTPTDAFRMVSRNNPALNCATSPKIDLSLWRDANGGGPIDHSCSWKTDSSSKCCNGRRTIKRTCVGGNSCRPGSSGCFGSSTITETCQPSCPRGNRNCNSDQGCSTRCSWRTVNTGICCSGRRTITRQCMGGSSCRPGVSGCAGSATTTERCTCNRYGAKCYRRCLNDNDNCRWQTLSTGKCCNGRKTVTRSCVGGRSCRAGQGGCRGETLISQTCRPNCPRYNPNCECSSVTPRPFPRCRGWFCRFNICRGGRCFFNISPRRRL